MFFTPSVTLGFMIGFTVLHVLHVLTNVLVFIGATKRIKQLLVPWMAFSIVFAGLILARVVLRVFMDDEYDVYR